MRYTALSLLLLVGVFFLLIVMRWAIPVDYSDKTQQLDGYIFQIVSRQDVFQSDVISRLFESRTVGRKEYLYIEKEYNVPNYFNFSKFKDELEKLLRKKDFKISSTRTSYNKKETIGIFDINFKKLNVYRLILHQERVAIVERPKKITFVKPVLPKGHGKVAIVLDDWGYKTTNLNMLLDLGIPVTISVLPNLSFSEEIAKNAYDNKIEVILHLPLEPKGETIRTEIDTITTSMKKQEVTQRLEGAINSVPNLKGVSNHMGSKATEDSNLMQLILQQLKKRGLYFLDSIVTNKSVCKKLAAKVGIKFAQRSIFLDNIEDEEYISAKLYELASMAIKNQVAVGVGHDRALTLKTIKKIAPQLQDNGIEFIYLSQVVK